MTPKRDTGVTPKRDAGVQLAENEDGGDKSEDASEKRREEYREKGEVARSNDVISVLVLFVALAYFLIFGDTLYSGMKAFTVHFFGLRYVGDVDATGMMMLLRGTLYHMALMLAPLVAGIIVVAVLGNVAQVGWIFSTKPLTPDLNKLNFFTKFFSTFFNKSALGTLVGSVAKISVVATVIYVTVSDDGRQISVISTLPLQEGIGFLLDRCMTVLLNVSLILIIIAIIDYFWNVYVMEEKMKMTKKEVADEQKEYEGNPHLKGQMRKRAQDLSNQRMMADVPTADVVVNNPTHYSVALRYRQGVDEAPVVVAKGADLMALRIRRVAQANGVPMVENKVLARGLYQHVKVGRRVPSQFFRAVAEVLAYVYRLRKFGKVTSQPATGHRMPGASGPARRPRNGSRVA